MNDDARLEHYRKLYTSVGQMTIRWGSLEMALDSLAYTIFTRVEARPPEFPRSMKSKITYLKKCFRDRFDLSTFREDGLAIIRRIKSGAEERNWIIHGVVVDLLKFESGNTIELLRTKYETNALKMERKSVTLRTIDEHSVHFRLLTQELLRLDLAVQNALDNRAGQVDP